MKKLLFIGCLVILFSCTKKEIKLPTLAEKGIQEMNDFSQVWLFFEIKDGDTIAHVNRKNTISSTHWIYNIDKRLPLYTFAETLNELKEKHANSIHSKEGMHNYFSYSDTLSNILSFYNFDNVKFNIENNYSEKVNTTNNHYFLKVFKHTFYLNGEKYNQPDFKEIFKKMQDTVSIKNKLILHLSFQKNVNFQDYLFYKTILQHYNRELTLNMQETVF